MLLGSDLWRRGIQGSLSLCPNLLVLRKLVIMAEKPLFALQPAQLATVRTDMRPSVRTVVYRGFYKESDMLTFYTDTRHAPALAGFAEVCLYAGQHSMSIPSSRTSLYTACSLLFLLGVSGEAVAGRPRRSTCSTRPGLRSAGTSPTRASSSALRGG